jgi:hypothetical protein
MYSPDNVTFFENAGKLHHLWQVLWNHEQRHPSVALAHHSIVDDAFFAIIPMPFWAQEK